jgi:hypothetical protein
MKTSNIILLTGGILLGAWLGDRAAMASGITQSAYNTVQNSGSSLTQRSTLNFAGSGVSCADAAPVTTCTFPGTTAPPASATVLGTNSGSSFISQTAATITAFLNVFTSLLQGLVPASGGGTTNFLRADGNWAAPPGGGGSGGGTSGWSGLPLTFVSNATQYAAPVGGALASTTETAVSLAAPAAATLSNLSVSLSAPLGVAATLAVTLENGTATPSALTCTTSSGGGTCVDNTHSVNVAQGALLSFKLVSGGTVTAGLPQIQIAFAIGTVGVGGITQLTGDVTAGPGSGSQAASVVKINGGAVPASQSCLGSNSLSQPIIGTCGGGSSWVIVPANTGGANTPTWSWFNQTSATLTTNANNFVIFGTSGGATNIQARVATLPTAPYTIYLTVIPVITTASGFPQAGAILTDGTKVLTWSIQANNGTFGGFVYPLAGAHYTNATTFSAGLSLIGNIGIPNAQPLCLYMRDDGTNRTLGFSPDFGTTRIQMFSETNTTFLTPTQYGVFVDPDGAGKAQTVFAQSVGITQP